MTTDQLTLAPAPPSEAAERVHRLRFEELVVPERLFRDLLLRELQPSSGVAPQELLLRRADSAMYSVKSAAFF